MQTPPALVETVTQFAFVSVVSVLVSYLLASTGAPWADPWLDRFDRAIGFDWVGVNRYVAGHPWLAWALRAGYQSFVWQPLVVIALLSFQMSHRLLQLFMIAWTLSLIVTLLGLAAAPAQSAYIFYGATQSGLPDLSAHVSNSQFSTLESLRSGGMRNLLDDELFGLVTFPSFHTAGAILFAWALWPLRWLRWLAIFLNALMIAAVPVIGAHYLVDVFAGLLVALAAIQTTYAIDRRAEPRQFHSS